MARRTALTVLDVGGDAERVTGLLASYPDVHGAGPDLAVHRILLDTFD
jgi:hypothetical protein